MVVRIKKLKNLISSKNTMIIISAIVMLILLISSTIAWFVLARDAKIELFNRSISEWDFVVSETPGGPQIANGSKLYFDIDDYVNLKDGRLAPGTSGSIDLYIRTSTDVITEFALYLDNSGIRLDAYSDDAITAEEKQAQMDANSEMLRNHIRFYQDPEHKIELSMTNPIIGELKKGEEVKKTIYWYWLYDGNEAIPEDLTDEEEIEEFLRQWDLDDNFISDYQDYISGTVDVKIFATQQKHDMATGGNVSSEGEISSEGQLSQGD